MKGLEQVLGPERSYVSSYAKKLGFTINPVFHDFITYTCKEKIELLKKTHPQGNWTNEMAVKALYGTIDQEIYGFVFPELGKLITTTVVGKVFADLDLDPPFSSRFEISSRDTPEGMDSGTCTPFASAKEMSRLSRIFVHEQPSLDEQIIDISIGGKGDEAHKVSLHLPYKAIFAILHQRYGEKVKKVDFF